MTDDRDETVRSAFSSTQDIQRLLLWIATDDGECSADRRNDIIRAAERVARLMREYK